MDIQDYLIEHAEVDWSSILQEWNWLLPPVFRVWLLTCVGDLFITVPDGAIYMLDVGAGELRRVAENRDEFCSKIDDADTANDWLMIPIVDELKGAGITLQGGQCYSYRMLPVLGGSYTAENRMLFSISEHFSGWGSVQRQISTLPNGAQIVIKPTNST